MTKRTLRNGTSIMGFPQRKGCVARNMGDLNSQVIAIHEEQKPSRTSGTENVFKSDRNE